MLNPMALESIKSHGDLLSAWTSRIIKARYQQSILGALWAIAQPAASVAIFSIIFTAFVPINTDGVPYVLFSFAALAPWTFFATSVTEMASSLVENMTLVTKIYFPREILPMASLLARFVDFLIALMIVVILMLYFGTPLVPLALVYVPAIIAVQVALTLGLGLAGAAMNVFYRDIKHLIELTLRVLLYVSPVIYPSSMVPEDLHQLYFLNPMAGIITAYRDVLIHGIAPGPYLTVAAVIAVAVLLVGYWFFRRVEAQFADVV